MMWGIWIFFVYDLMKPDWPVSELGEPKEGLCIVHLVRNHLLHHISGMHINGADGHDLLAITFSQFPQQVSDEGI